MVGDTLAAKRVSIGLGVTRHGTTGAPPPPPLPPPSSPCSSAMPLLDWSRQRLDAAALSAKDLHKALGETKARTVWLHGNRLDHAAAPLVGSALYGASPRVARLMLAQNALGDAGLAELAESAGEEAEGALRSFGLGINELGAPAAAALAAKLRGGSLASPHSVCEGSRAFAL